jgi:molybdopterin converting factor small subunit
MITVRLFGMTKSLADNQSSLTLALGRNQSVKGVIELVNKRYPKIGELIYQKKILVSVNQEIAHDDTKVQEGDEVALLPPFAGGTPTGRLQSDRWDGRVRINARSNEHSRAG